MSIEKPSSGEKAPSRILEELGFVKVEEEYLDAGTPKTFDIFRGIGTLTTVAYDEEGNTWELERDAEAELLARDFSHAPSVLAPGPDDIVN